MLLVAALFAFLYQSGLTVPSSQTSGVGCYPIDLRNTIARAFYGTMAATL